MPVPKSPAMGWCAGYKACLSDFEKMAAARFAGTGFGDHMRHSIADLIATLRNDAAVIEHEYKNRDQRAELRTGQA
jgi:hypothetical protein